MRRGLSHATFRRWRRCRDWPRALSAPWICSPSCRRRSTERGSGRAAQPSNCSQNRAREPKRAVSAVAIRRARRSTAATGIAAIAAMVAGDAPNTSRAPGSARLREMPDDHDRRAREGDDALVRRRRGRGVLHAARRRDLGRPEAAVAEAQVEERERQPVAQARSRLEADQRVDRPRRQPRNLLEAALLGELAREVEEREVDGDQRAARGAVEQAPFRPVGVARGRREREWLLAIHGISPRRRVILRFAGSRAGLRIDWCETTSTIPKRQGNIHAHHRRSIHARPAAARPGPAAHPSRGAHAHHPQLDRAHRRPHPQALPLLRRRRRAARRAPAPRQEPAPERILHAQSRHPPRGRRPRHPPLHPRAPAAREPPRYPAPSSTCAGARVSAKPTKPSRASSSSPQISFEHACHLLRSLEKQNEICLDDCEGCGSLLVVMRYAERPKACEFCAASRPPARPGLSVGDC